MSATFPPPPTSREMGELWSHFHPWHPHAFWLGQIPLHRIEACVATTSRYLLDPIAQLVLAAFPPAPAPVPFGELYQRTGLPKGLLRSTLAALTTRGILQGWENDSWRLVVDLSVADSLQELSVEHRERRVFHFCQGSQAEMPAFVSWDGAINSLAPGKQANWRFRPRALQHCIEASAEWKSTRGFPTDVLRLEQLPAGPVSVLGDWQKVVVHHVVQVPVAIIAGQRSLAFPLAPASWSWRAGPPLFHFPTLAETAAFLDVPLTPLPVTAWMEAWELARRPLGLPHGEILEYTASSHGPRVIIRLPVASVRKNLSTGSAPWLLAGTGALRCAARIEFRD